MHFWFNPQSSLGMFSHFSTVTNKLPEVVYFVCCKCVCMKCRDEGSLVSRRREQVWNDCSCFHKGQTKHFCKALQPLYSLKFSHLSFFSVLHLAQCRYSVSCFILITHYYFRVNVSNWWISPPAWIMDVLTLLCSCSHSFSSFLYFCGLFFFLSLRENISNCCWTCPYWRSGESSCWPAASTGWATNPPTSPTLTTRQPTRLHSSPGC